MATHVVAVVALVATSAWSAVALQSQSRSAAAAESHKAEVGSVVEATTSVWSGCKRDGDWNISHAPGPQPEDLRFIHIPRSMGSTVERCEKLFPGFIENTPTNPRTAHRELWGPSNKRVNGKESPPAGYAPFPWHQKTTGKLMKCYPQHLPPAVFQSLDPKQQVYPHNKDANFCVVRNPYDRLISQFGFANVFFKKKWGFKYNCTADGMNAYFLERLQFYKTFPEMEDCHYLPQALFVYGYNNATERADPSEKWCDNVLRYETMGPEFNTLMERKGYGVRIFAQPGSTGPTASSETCQKLKASDLSEEVKLMAQDIYRDDFELLGYKM